MSTVSQKFNYNWDLECTKDEGPRELLQTLGDGYKKLAISWKKDERRSMVLDHFQVTLIVKHNYHTSKAILITNMAPTSWMLQLLMPEGSFHSTFHSTFETQRH